LLLAATGAVRSQGLRDDRTWSDEDYVIMGTLGLYERELPRVFTHSEIYSPSLRKCLDFLLLKTPYPPLQHVVVYAARNTRNPILAVRWVFWGLGLGVPLAVFLVAKSVSSGGAALFCMGLVAASPALTLTSQQVRWYALAPLFATAAGVLLWACCHGAKARYWGAYAGCASLLLQVHYFAALALPAHAIYVLTTAPRSWKRFAFAWTAIGLLSAPWYVYALPSQLVYVQDDFLALHVAPDEPWARPVTVKDVIAWQAYDWLMSMGLQPSPLRVRFLLPALLVGLWLLWVAWNAGNTLRRGLARIGPVTFASALVGQTLYAWDVGNMTPLSWTYFVMWVPLVSLSLGIGLLQIRGPWHLAVGGVFLGLSLWSLFDRRFPDQIDRSVSLSSYPQTVALIEREVDAGTAVAYLDATDARKMSLFLRSPVLQLVGWPTASEPRASRIDRILWVTPRGTPVHAPPDPAWSLPRPFATLDWTVVSVSCRGSRPGC
jgi:hypothetical protein